MQIVDFSRSYFTFRVDVLKRPPVTVSHPPPFTVNNARIQADCVCDIADTETGATHQFVLGASCKTEQVGVKRDLFTEPNADFIPVINSEFFMHFKAYDRADKGIMLHPPSLGAQPERMVVKVSDAFDSIRIDVVYKEAEQLLSIDKVIEATFGNRPIVGRTEIIGEKYRAVIHYPIKTMNVSERDKIFQTDTGPILVPLFSPSSSRLVDQLELAFIAFNQSDFAEIILRDKTPVAENISVYHYSKRMRLSCSNALYCL